MTTGAGTDETPTVVVVGAGLAGSLMTILLARRGFAVEVHERRADPRCAGAHDDGRSINLGMSKRALDALDRVDLLDDVVRRSVPMRGRIIHQPNGRLRRQPYGTADDEILYSARRRELNATLIEAADAHPRVRFHFRSRVRGLDKQRTPLAVHVTDEAGVTNAVPASFVVGSDGAFSTVRRLMHRGERARYRQDFLDWGHKELTIPPTSDGRPHLELNALHVWPRRTGLIVAHPNQDGSLTATLFLPHDGAVSFDALDTPQRVREFLAAEFPETQHLMPDVAEEFLTRPVGDLVTIRTAPWHYGGRVVLIGDAAHAVYPFYGQGMNAALEDCLALDECIGRTPADLDAAFLHFQQERKRHTDVLADLSEANFVEFRDGMRDPWRLARWQADLALNRLFPRRWVPLYSLVSHSTVPYADALRRVKRQERLLAASGLALTATAAAAAAVVRRSPRRRVAGR